MVYMYTCTWTGMVCVQTNAMLWDVWCHVRRVCGRQTDLNTNKIIQGDYICTVSRDHLTHNENKVF